MHLVGNVLYIQLPFLNTIETFHAFIRQCAVHIVTFSKNHRKISCIQQAMCYTYSSLFYNTERFHAFSRQYAVHIAAFSTKQKDFMHLVGNVLYIIQLPFLNTTERFHAFSRQCAVHIAASSKHHRKFHAFSRQCAVHRATFSKHLRKISCIQQAICCTYSCLF